MFIIKKIIIICLALIVLIKSRCVPKLSQNEMPNVSNNEEKIYKTNCNIAKHKIIQPNVLLSIV